MKIDMTEFVMLAGTELAEQMIRNRVTLNKNHIDLILDYAEEQCSSMYHVRMEPDSPVFYMYFEHKLDMDNMIIFSQNIDPATDDDSKYH
jgi:hypothetical protein